MTPKKEWFIVCPGNYKTGGTELLHQLSASLAKRGIKSTMVYTGQESAMTIHDELRQYTESFIPIKELKDAKGQVIVFPERCPIESRRYKKSITIMWWLSVDNFTGLYYTDILQKREGLRYRLRVKLGGG